MRKLPRNEENDDAKEEKWCVDNMQVHYDKLRVQVTK